jgi:hypothetical protein
MNGRFIWLTICFNGSMRFDFQKRNLYRICCSVFKQYKIEKWAAWQNWRMHCFLFQRTRYPNHNAHLGKIPSFLQNYRSKNKFLTNIFVNVCQCKAGLAFKSKNYYIVSQNCMYFMRENSPKLRQKRKWALWMGRRDDLEIFYSFVFS